MKNNYQSFRNKLANILIDEKVVMFIILLNASLFIALDINPTLVSEIGPWVEWIDFACVVFFIIEASIKVNRNNFKGYLKDHWNKLDFFIVIASIPVLLEPFMSEIGPEYGWVGVFRVARVFRLTRVLRTLRIVKYTHDNPSKVFIKIKYPIYLVLVVASSNLIIEIFDFSADWTSNYLRYYPSFIILSITWLVSRLYSVFHEIRIHPHLKDEKTSINEAVESIISALFQIFIWTIGLMLAFEKAGYSTTTILAGVGLGGMAVALASQDFIGNLIGGILLYFKDSFKIGDDIAVGGFEGKVIKLGISDIRIEDLSGKVTSLPNKMFISEPIENRSKADLAPDRISIRIAKNVSSQKLKRATEIIMEQAKSNPYVKDDYSVRFGPMSEHVHELYFEYFLDNDTLEKSHTNIEPLKELVNEQNANIYVKIIEALQDEEIDLG